MTNLINLKSNKIKTILLIVMLLMLLSAFLGSLLLGYIRTSFNDLIQAYYDFNNSTEHIVIRESRMARAVIALLVGASLSLAGLLMQTLTKNPMASPGLLGVNSGAVFFTVLIYSYVPQLFYSYGVLSAFLGAALAVILVYTLAGGFRGSVDTFDLTLSGAAVTALFTSLSQIILYKDQRTMEEILFWLTGSVEGRDLDGIIKYIPLLMLAWLWSFFIWKKLNLFSLGEDIAKGLGLNTAALKIQIIILVVILSGISVAVAGPIALIGLIVPHLAFALVGSEFRWSIPYSMVMGAILLLAADIAARFIAYPREIPVGAVTAILGTPFFIYTARRAENR
jgi:iron complex transport system permease protein